MRPARTEGRTLSLAALQLLATSGGELLESVDVTGALEHSYSRIAALLDLDLYLHYEMQDGLPPLRLLVAEGIPRHQRPRFEQLSLGEAICGRACERGEPIVVEAVQSSGDPRTARVRALGVTAYACHPLVCGTQVLGTLSFGSRRLQAFPAETLAILAAVSSQVAMVVRRRQMETLLREEERRKDRFVALLAHELRNPLAPLRSGLELLGSLAPTPGGALPVVQGMQRHLARIVRLVDDLLDASCIPPVDGATAAMRPPRAEGASSSSPSPSPSASGRSVTVSHKPLRVLVVDDNVDAAAMLAALIELNGDMVQTAHDGAAAVALATQLRPEAIFMDLGMPGMDGFQAAQAIRQLAVPQPVICALTGWGSDTDRLATGRSGFDHHLVKPVEFEAIAQVLEPLRAQLGLAPPQAGASR